MKANLHMRPFLTLAAVLLLAGRAEAAEVCGDRQDNDGNGMTDEGCYPAPQTGVCASPLSCLDTGWVGWATGSLRYDLPPDVAPTSPWGPPVALRRMYTSQYAPPSTPSSFNRTPLGPRWQHNYMSWIDRLPNNDFVIHTAQGEDVLVNGQTGVPQRGHHVHYVYLGTFISVVTMDRSVLTYNASGQLIEASDKFGNTVRMAWTTTPAGSVVSTVTDATTTRRLSFGYTASLLTSVELQFLIGGTWTTFHTTTYAYAGGELASVTIGGQLAQRNVYTSGYLTQIDDGEGRRIAAFRFSSARPGEANLIDTAQGTVGFEFGSTRSVCSAQTVLYFNKANANSCDSDEDCGSGALCGGQTGPGATGTCFRGARCLTVDGSSGQSLVTSVRAIGPGSEACTGACAEVTQYVWNVSTLDLGAVKDGLGSYTTTEYNANGLPTRIVYADTDADAGNGGGQQTVYLKYSDSLLTEIRRPSAIGNGASCTATSGTGCATTRYSYTTRYAVASTTQTGYTLSSTGSVVPFSNQTRYTYDAFGRITSIDGPVSGDFDKVIFTYQSSADPTQNGFLASRVTRATVPTLGFPIYDEVYRYDFWGNPVEWLDLNGQRSCRTYDAARNYPTRTSVEMTGGLGRCDVDDPADLIEEYSRDSALRPTRSMRADGSCVHFEYDEKGRLARTRRRDDCDPASPGDRAEYTYDHDGLLTERATYDAAGTVKHRALSTYHDSRRLHGVPSPVDPSKVETLDYDERGVITAINSEYNLGRTEFDVDANYQVRSVARFNSPNTSDTWRLGHDALGRTTTLTDPDQKALVTTYDDLGRPVRQVSPDQASMNLDRSFTALSRVESETNLMQTRRFTYDPLGRPLTAEDVGGCGLTPQPEAEYVYDALQGRTCPSAQGCFNLRGRLAYSRITLTCGGPDGTLDQETFYSYDPAGRLIGEYIRDDTGRVADQTYEWTKNGTLAQVTLPSGTALGWTHGDETGNSDTDLVTAVWRTTPATPIVDNVQWNPFGPLKQYDRQDTISGSALRMTIDRNLAYRPTSIHLDGQTFGGPYYRLLLTEDAKGRVKSRDYYPSDPQMPGVFDSYYLYDGQDRVLCEASTPVTGCPSSGATIKNNHVDAFTGAGDRQTLLRPVAGSSGGISNVFALAPGSHQIESVAQADGSTPLGTTTYTYDALGRRTSEDNIGPRTSYARRSYTYDTRGNLAGVRGTAPFGGAWHAYFVHSAFDARNRRVFKVVYDLTALKLQHWFFYYDAYDRLTEVRYVPDTSVLGTFTTYQLIWLDDLLVAYWQTDSPSGTTSKRYVSFDETGRPVRMHSWETGNSRVTWAINPDAWGMDSVVIGASVYQPIAFAGQYVDGETASYLDDGTTRYRPGLVLNGFRTYDPFTGGFLQLDPLVEQTWNAYGYADGNPVGRSDPSGLKAAEPRRCSAVSHRGGEDGPILTDGVYAPQYSNCSLPSPIPIGTAWSSGRTGGTGGGGIGGGAPPQKPNVPTTPARGIPESAVRVLDNTTCAEDVAWLFSSNRGADFQDGGPLHWMRQRWMVLAYRSWFTTDFLPWARSNGLNLGNVTQEELPCFEAKVLRATAMRKGY
jgi:RHS repeat-associated protein